MTESPEELAAVEQLLAESDALRGWLARLDQAPGVAPGAVRDRVRADYQRRLDQVTAGLRAHADVIGGKLDADRAERDELQARATAAREALAEAELRHAVGEYDQDRFESERRRHGSDIETFELSLGAVADRIARLDEVHALVEAPRPLEIDFEPLVAEPVVIPEVHVTIDDQVDLVAIADLAPDGEDALAIFEEELDVVDPVAPTQAPGPSLDIGPLSFRPSGNGNDVVRTPPTVSPYQRPFDSAPPLGIPGADVPPRFVRPGERLGGHPAPPATPPVESVVPATAAPVQEAGLAAVVPEVNTVPVGRTLRCGECGAMNRPLEWYCEKCGAELTAV